MSQDIATLGIRVDAREVRDGDRALDNFERTGARVERRTGQVNAAMARMARAAAAVASALAVFEAIKVADEISLMDARLKLATKSMHEFAQAQRDVYEIAQKNNVALGAVASLYTKLADPVRTAGGSMREVRGIVDAFSTSLRVSGASTVEASASIMQFAQAMAAGRLNGDEFRSLAEASPRFMKALAEGMNVPIGRLKDLGAEGKLTADIVGNALLKSLDKLNQEAQSLPDTVGGAFTRLKNDVALAIDAINKSTSSTTGLSGMIDGVRSLIPAVRDELARSFAAVAAWIDKNRDGLRESFERAVALVAQMWELAKAVASVAGSLVEAGNNFGIFKAALTGAALAVAGIQDGVKLISASFVAVGGTIVEHAIAPMMKFMEISAKVVGLFNEDMAAKIRGGIAETQGYLKGMGDYVRGVEAEFAAGDTAVNRLMRDIYGAESATLSLATAGQRVATTFDQLKAPKNGPTEEQKKAYEKASKAADSYIDKLRQEREEIGLTEDQLAMLNAERAAAKAPTAQQKKQIMELADAVMHESQAWNLAKKAQEAAEKADSEHYDNLRQSTKAIDDRIERMQQEIDLHGLTGKAAVEAERAKLEAKLAAGPATHAELMALDAQIAKLNELAELAGKKETLDKTKKATEEQASYYERMADRMGDAITDSLMRGFESGKGFFSNMWNTIKNTIKTQALSSIVGGSVNALFGTLLGAIPGMAMAGGGAAAGGGGGGMATGAALGVGGLAGLFGAGGLTGSLMAGAGWLTGATTLGGSLAAAGSLAATGTLAGLTSSLGMVAGALGPIALGIGAAVAIWKKIDTSGTYHTGGAAMASSSGVSSVTARSLNMEAIRTNADTQKFVSELASGMVGILDATALAFGKTAGYTAATAFADDTSKDGAWGSLVIQKMGQTVVDWQQTKAGKWAPKTFADGKAGQDQYLAALAGSVRDALNSIGLPQWATKMLDELGKGATIEELGKVVEKINQTQAALSAMRAQLVGFDQLSDGAVSALISAAGGIEKLFGAASGYYDNFYTQAEKVAAVGGQVSKAFADLGLTMPTSREGFRALVEQQMALGASAAPTVAALLNLQGAVAQLYPELEQAADAAMSAADILAERNELQKQLDKLTLSETQQLAKQRAALHESNRALFDQVQAAQAAKDAQDAARESLQKLADDYRGLTDSLQSFGLSLLTGELSTLTTAQQEAEARKQFEKTAELAQAGDVEAIRKFEDVARNFLSISQKANGGDARYMADYAAVLAITDKLATMTDSRADTALLQLDAAERQVVAIEALAAVERASANSLATIAASAAPPVAQDNAILAGIIDRLREEVRSQGDKANKVAQETAVGIADANRAVALHVGEKIVSAVSTGRQRFTADNTAAALDR